MPTYDVTYTDPSLGETTIEVTCDHTVVDANDYRFQDASNNDVWYEIPANVINVVEQ